MNLLNENASIEASRAICRPNRKRRSVPPPEAREWLTPREVALLLGCSVATVHRLRRGVIAGAEPLPFHQYGRKFVFGKMSMLRWRERHEKRALA